MNKKFLEICKRIMHDGGTSVVGCVVPEGMTATSDFDQVDGPLIFVGRRLGCGNWYTPKHFWKSVRYINGYTVVY